MAWPQTVTKEDLIITYYRGSGAGGQHRNKTDSAVRIRHKITGNVAQAEEHKSQAQNKKTAFKRLCDILVPLMKKAHQIEIVKEDTERIRTYHAIKDEVKDHRTGKTYRYKDVMNGKLDPLINDLTNTAAQENKE